MGNAKYAAMRMTASIGVAVLLRSRRPVRCARTPRQMISGYEQAKSVLYKLRRDYGLDAPAV